MWKRDKEGKPIPMSDGFTPFQGQVYWANMGDIPQENSTDSRQRGIRMVLVVQDDNLTERWSSVVIIPITSYKDNGVRQHEVFINKTGMPAKILCSQIQVLDKRKHFIQDEHLHEEPIAELSQKEFVRVVTNLYEQVLGFQISKQPRG